MIGNTAANILAGNLGNDVLTGGAGGDTFLFDTKPNKTANVDHVTDMVHLTDFIELDHTIFSKIKIGTGHLKKSAFFAHDGAHKAHDSSDRIIYDKTSGALYYDKDGDGDITPSCSPSSTAAPTTSAPRIFSSWRKVESLRATVSNFGHSGRLPEGRRRAARAFPDVPFLFCPNSSQEVLRHSQVGRSSQAAQQGNEHGALYVRGGLHRGIVAAQMNNPENRVEAVGRKACEAVGGKLIGSRNGSATMISTIIADVRK